MSFSCSVILSTTSHTVLQVQLKAYLPTMPRQSSGGPYHTAQMMELPDVGIIAIYTEEKSASSPLQKVAQARVS